MLTSLYVVIMATLYIGHTWYLILLKRHARIRQVDWPMRCYDRASHGRNFVAQYTPLALILLAMVEIGGAPALAMHGLGIMLVAAALLHCHSFGFPARNSSGVAAMLLVTSMYAITMTLALAQYAGVDDLPDAPLMALLAHVR
jgi:uncharacterized membrane protein YecN with MAPEG domain